MFSPVSRTSLANANASFHAWAIDISDGASASARFCLRRVGDVWDAAATRLIKPGAASSNDALIHKPAVAGHATEHQHKRMHMRTHASLWCNAEFIWYLCTAIRDTRYANKSIAWWWEYGGDVVAHDRWMDSVYNICVSIFIALSYRNSSSKYNHSDRSLCIKAFLPRIVVCTCESYCTSETFVQTICGKWDVPDVTNTDVFWINWMQCCVTCPRKMIWQRRSLRWFVNDMLCYLSQLII